MLNIQPFNDFWINCVVNDKLSIITSMEPSYKKCAFLNSYKYEFTGSSCWWRELAITSSSCLYENLDIIQENFTYVNPQRIIEGLINKLNSGCYISILVDLFSWLPNSVDWQRNHYHHYRMLTGYDDEKKVFFTISDTLNGYEQSEVSFERLIESIVLNDGEFFVQQHKYKREVNPYTYSFHDVYKFAEELKENIKKILYSRIWIVPLDIDPLRIYTQITKFADRQKANLMLFEQLKKDGLISDYQTHVLQTRCTDIFNQWSILKGKNIKADIKKENIDIDYLNAITFSALNLEYKMWCDFISFVSSKFNIALEHIEYEMDVSDKWSLNIIVNYTNVNGGLNAANDINGFCLLLDSDDNYVKSVKAQDNKIIIYTKASYYYLNQISDLKLYYRQSPSENIITDNNGSFLPQLNGVRVDKFVDSYFITNMFCGFHKNWTEEYMDFSYENALRIDCSQKIFNENICTISEIVDDEEQNSAIICYKFNYSNDKAQNIRFYIGYSEPIKVWCNGKLVLTNENKITPISHNDFFFETSDRCIEVVMCLQNKNINEYFKLRGVMVKVVLL